MVVKRKTKVAAALLSALFALVLGVSACGSSSSDEDDTSATGDVAPKTALVTFHANGGTFTGGANTATQTVTQGVVTALKTTTELELTRSGYAFAGWAKAEEAEVVYADGDKITLSEDITLYALWKNATITVTFLEDKSDLDVHYDDDAKTLTATPPNASKSYRYQWILNDYEITDETGATLTITDAVVTAAGLESGNGCDLLVTATESDVPDGVTAPVYTAYIVILYTE